MAKFALFKCVSKDCSEVVYDFEFVEDYVKTLPEQEQTELSTLVSGEAAAENERGPLMKNYMPLDHPLSLMVFFCIHWQAGA